MELKIYSSKGPYLLFDSDDEFTDFCLAPYAEVEKSESGDINSYHGVYSAEYLWCIEAGVLFVIKDDNSLVEKRGCVNKRVPLRFPDEQGFLNRRDNMVLIQMQVENIEPYFILKRLQRHQNNESICQEEKEAQF